jgi:hypothetical protein
VLESFAGQSTAWKYYAEQGLLATEQARHRRQRGWPRNPGRVLSRIASRRKPPAEGAKLDGEVARRRLLKQAEGKGLDREVEERIAEIKQNIEELRKRKSEWMSMPTIRNWNSSSWFWPGN